MKAHGRRMACHDRHWEILEAYGKRMAEPWQCTLLLVAGKLQSNGSVMGVLW